MQTVKVTAASGDYEVRIGAGLLARAAHELGDLAAGRRLIVVTDETVAALHAAPLLASLGLSARDLLAVPPGEAAKSFRGLESLLTALLERRLERSDLLIALGGGVVGDLAGFAAAIYKRGLDFVQAPTTLLAQVDSSVGGKTAIDAPQGKNLIGAFHAPRRVIADLSLLTTLPAREVRCGYAEIVKTALVGDAGFFAWLEQAGAQVLANEADATERAVARSVEMKAEIVSEDERESGRRALLNLGHTFGHALEAETGFSGTLLHGEAVAVGLCLAFRLAADLGRCPPDDARRVELCLAAAGLATELGDIWPSGAPPADRLVAHMTQDKKAQGGVLTFVLPERVGRCFLARDVEPARLTRFLRAQGAA